MALEFSAQAKQQIERLRTRYPTRQAALLPVLHLAQDEFGYLSDEAIELVAQHARRCRPRTSSAWSPSTRCSTASRTGTNELMVCTNVSCMLRGGVRHPPPHREAARHQAGRDHRRRRLHAGRGGVPGRLRERPDDDLRARVLPRPDAREGRQDPRRPQEALPRAARSAAAGGGGRPGTARPAAIAVGPPAKSKPQC